MRRGPQGPKYGMTMPEIARATGMSLRSVTSAYANAMRKLKALPDADLVLTALMDSGDLVPIGCGSVECRRDFVSEWGEEA